MATKNKKSNASNEPSKVVGASESPEQHIWKGPGNLIWQGQTLQPGSIIPNYEPFEAEKVEH